MVPLALNVAFGSLFCRRAHEIFASISSRHGEIGHYADLFQWIDVTPVKSPHLEQLQQQTTAANAEAGREIQWLGRIMELANLRFSSMAYFLIQSVTSWDFHILALLSGGSVATDLMCADGSKPWVSGRRWARWRTWHTTIPSGCIP